MSLPKELQSTAVVRFQDCDPFQHLNNARYIDYFLNAREDQLKQFYGFDIFGHSKTSNAGWVVTRTHIAYLFPAVVMEEVLIETRLVHMADSAIVVEGIMFDKKRQRVKSVIWIEFTYVSLLTGRTTHHGPDLMQFFSEVVDSADYRPDEFNTRADQLKRQYRRQPAGVTVE